MPRETLADRLQQLRRGFAQRLLDDRRFRVTRPTPHQRPEQIDSALWPVVPPPVGLRSSRRIK
jgi:hypothetical protein